MPRIPIIAVLSFLIAAAVVAEPQRGRSIRAHQPGRGAALEVTFDGASIRIAGLSRGATAAVMAVSRDNRAGVTLLKRLDERLEDADRDGIVTHQFDEPLPFFTVVAIVDERDGKYAVVTPGWLPVLLDADNVTRMNGRREIDAFQDARQFVEALLVRPGQGAFVATVGEGGPEDGDDRQDERVTLAFARMHSHPRDARREDREPPRSPESLRPNDVLIVVDAVNLATLVAEGRGPQ